MNYAAQTTWPSNTEKLSICNKRSRTSRKRHTLETSHTRDRDRTGGIQSPFARPDPTKRLMLGLGWYILSGQIPAAKAPGEELKAHKEELKMSVF